MDRAHAENLTQTTFLAKNLLHRVKTALDTELPAQFGEVWSRIDSANEAAQAFQGRVDGSFKQLGDEFRQETEERSALMEEANRQIAGNVEALEAT